ncbi:a-factor receptor [Serendipita sp. 411]|nr:a-factor receptor [Serendipita sp. 411]
MDLLIGLGIPALVMILHYIVQGHRYDILEDYGCWPTIYMTPLAIPLVLLWPLLISAVSIPYCVLSYRSFYRHRANFQKYLAPGTSSPSPTFSSPRSPGSPRSPHSPRSPSSPIPAARQFLTPDRYLRLMALSSMELLLVLPLNLLSFISNLTSSSSSPALRPYSSWGDVHSNFGRIVYVTRFMMNNSGDKIKVHFVKFEVARWAIPITGWLFFVFFGVSVEAKRDYRRWWNTVRNLVVTKGSGSGGGGGGKRSGGSGGGGGGSDDEGYNRGYGSQSTLLGRMFKQRRPSITTTEGMGTMKSIATTITTTNGDADERKNGDRLTALPTSPTTSLRTDHKSRMERRRQRLALADSLADEEEEEVQSPTDLVHVPPLQIPDSIYHPHLHTSPPSSSGCESTTPMGTLGKHSWDSNKPLPPTPFPSRPPSLAISLHMGGGGGVGAGVGVRHLPPPPPPPLPPMPSMPSMPLPLLSITDEFGTVRRTTTDPNPNLNRDLEMGIESDGETTEGGGETETVYHTPALSNYRLSLASSLVYPHQHQHQQQQQPSIPDVSVSVPGGWPSLTVPSSSTATGRKKDGKGKGKGKGRVYPDPSWGYY